ncbi:MAG: urease accessory protein UreF [Chloroflexi bacterium]|nr:urease accessory protein UreF [Chloroflexota bacterium]
MMSMDPSAYLSALQLADSLFPSGAFAHSAGLEGMMRRKLVRSSADVEALIRDLLRAQMASCDGVALLNAHRAALRGDLAEAAEIDAYLTAMKLPAELRTAATGMGRRLLTEAAAFSEHPSIVAYRRSVMAGEAPGAYAVALAVVDAALGVPEEAAFLSLGYGFAAGMWAAALRLLPVGHSDVQAALHQTRPLLAGLLADVRERPWQDMESFAPLADLAAMGHETDDLRMFAS